MAGSGVNAEDIATELQSINFTPNLEPITYSTSGADIDSYLRARKEENILKSIEEAVRSTARDFDLFLAQNVNIDWKERKQQIFQRFGLTSKQGVDSGSKDVEKVSKPASSSWGKSSLGRLVLGPIAGDGEFVDVTLLGPQTNGAPKFAASQKQTFTMQRRKYTEVVRALNKSRLNRNPFPISHVFASAFSQVNGNDTRSQQLHDGWKIITMISGESRTEPVPERKYAHVHFSSQKQSRETTNLRRQIVLGSKKYLEEQFWSVVEAEIAKHPHSAQVGGVPSVYNKIRAFLSLKFIKGDRYIKDNLEIVNNVPIWALVYYMIRSGHAKEALELALQMEKSFQKIERSFITYLKAFVTSPDNRLPRDLLERLHNEFNQHIRFFDEKSDPYKYALYKIIGRCELSKRAFPEVVGTTEDWLWVHLMLTREDDVDSINQVNERYSLVDLQRLIIQFGARHFNPNKTNPGLYFQVLLLGGLFEWAIQYLYSFSQIDAVHFSIALTYYGLLRPITNIEKNESDLLVMDMDENPYLNFVRLVGCYTKDFRRSDPTDAVDYLILICLNKDLPQGYGSQHLKMCHEALKELVLETREFSRLIGDVRADGTRIPGAIEERMQLISLPNEEQYLRAITEQAAIKADEDGRTADAILLYQLSEEYDTVVSIINKSLGEAISVVELGRPMSSLPEGLPLMISATEDPAQLARNMMKVYSDNPAILSKVSRRSRETCTILLQIVNAREAFSRKDWDACLKEIDNTGILSLSSQADIGTVRRKAQQFSGLQESIARNVPLILVMVMQCCVNIAHSFKESEYSNAGRIAKMEELRNCARNCMIYAGMIQYRMPREVYSQLTNLEALL